MENQNIDYLSQFSQEVLEIYNKGKKHIEKGNYDLAHYQYNKL